MPIVGLSLEATREYQSKFDPDVGTPQASRFTISTLDSRVAGKLKDMGTTMHIDPTRPDDDVATSVNMEDVNFQTVQFGVSAWENVVDDKGQPIEYKTVGRRLAGKSYKIIHEDVLSLLPLSVINELAEEVRKVNELEEDAAKNSGEQSSPSNSSPSTTVQTAQNSSNENGGATSPQPAAT